MKSKRLAFSAVIAAIYALVTIYANPLSYGPIQIRFAEALCIIPMFMPEGILGITLGCLIANIWSPFLIYDITFGTLVTLISAILTRLLRKKPILAVLPPIILNALILPLIWWGFGLDGNAYWFNVVTMLAGQSIAIIGLGIPLYYALRKPINIYINNVNDNSQNKKSLSIKDKFKRDKKNKSD